MEKTVRLTAIAALIVLPGLVAVAKNHASDVFSLKIWKLTIPLDDNGDGKPDEISTEDLRYFEDPEFFFLSDTKNSIVFRARCGAPTTKNSSYPRCELREMKPDGGDEASWGTNDGLVHNMTITAAINKLPTKKRHVVCAQIHDSEDDILMVRLEDEKLFIERNELEPVYLTKDYELGTFFKLMIIAEKGRIRALYEGKVIMEWPIERDGMYFKAGCYTQSNVDKGDAPDDYAEVEIQALYVTHKPD